jgi:DNA-directed RNA polymerase subunit RPC12/RpoP
MGYYKACPNCGHKPDRGWFKIFKCRKCGRRYCYQCPGSYQGKECPACGSKDYETAGECA